MISFLTIDGFYEIAKYQGVSNLVAVWQVTCHRFVIKTSRHEFINILGRWRSLNTVMNDDPGREARLDTG